MKSIAILLGVLIVLAGALALTDTIQTYRDSGFSDTGITFRDGATIYVQVWDNSTNGSTMRFTKSC